MRTRIVFLFASFLAACGSEEVPRESAPPLAWVPDESKPLEQLLAEFYNRYDSGYDRGLVRERVAKMAEDVRKGLFSIDARRGLAIGVHLLTGDGRLHFRKNADGISLRPDLVLKDGHGNCLGLSTVFLLVAEELGVDAWAVASPYPLHVSVECGGDLFDLQEDGPKPVSRSQRLLWGEVGSSRRFGARLSKSQVVALHAMTVGYKRGHATKAKDLYRLAAEVDPDCSAAQWGLALVAHADGDSELALEHISRAVELNPLSPGAQLVKSKLEEARGNQVAADAARRKAREILGSKSSPAVPLPD